MRRTLVRHDALDNVHLGMAVSFITSVLGGVDWPAAAAFLAAVYSLILIGERIVRWFRKGKRDVDASE